MSETRESMNKSMAVLGRYVRRLTSESDRNYAAWLRANTPKAEDTHAE
jgi:hypothetical protein